MSNLSENISSLSPCSAMEPVSNTALVLEGGGQRGIYTAGVLDSWLYRGYNPFSILIGTSAGAQNLSSYMTCQKGFARRAIFQLTKQPHFFKVKRSFIGRHIVDLDWYFDQFERTTDALNIERGLSRMSNREVLFSATRISNRRADFFSPTKDNWLQLLKASSALPLLYRHGVEIDNQYYVDGGLAAPIPVREAYERGARKIVVIRTNPKDAQIESPWAHKLKAWLCTHQRCPAIIDLITHHELAYRKALAFIDNPPKGVEIMQVFPDQALASKLVNSDYADLDKDYSTGVQSGFDFLTQYGGDLLG